MFKTFVSFLSGHATYMDKFTSVFQESRTERNMQTHDIKCGKLKRKLNCENQNKRHAKVKNSNQEIFQLQGTVHHHILKYSTVIHFNH